MNGTPGNVSIIYTDKDTEAQALISKRSIIFGEDGSLWAQGKQYIPINAKFTDTILGNAKIFYGVCNTLESESSKIITCNEFTLNDLIIGSIIFITFTKNNTADAQQLTLNVNNTGEKHIKKLYKNYIPTVLTINEEFVANQTYLFIYDGQDWILINSNYSQLSPNYEISNDTDNLNLESGDTYETAFSKIEKTINDNEQTVSSALNDLNSRVNEIEVPVISVNGMTGAVTIDMSLSPNYEISNDTDNLNLESGDTYETAFAKLEKIINDNEQTISAALNDLNSRVNEIEVPVISVNGMTGAVTIDMSLSQNYEISNDTDNLNLESGDTYETAFAKLEKTINDNEQTISSALNDLNSRVNEIEVPVISVNGMTGAVTIDMSLSQNYEISNDTDNLNLESGDTYETAFSKLEKTINDNERTISATLNDLNSRVNEIEVPVISVNGMTGAVTIDMSLSPNYEISNDIDNLNLESGDTYETAFAKLEKTINDNEQTISSALNDLNSRVNEIEVPVISVNGMTGAVTINMSLSSNYEISNDTDNLNLESGDTYETAFAKLEKIINDNEQTISAALNDLNDKINFILNKIM